MSVGGGGRPGNMPHILPLSISGSVDNSDRGARYLIVHLNLLIEIKKNIPMGVPVLSLLEQIFAGQTLVTVT